MDRVEGRKGSNRNKQDNIVRWCMCHLPRDTGPLKRHYKSIRQLITQKLKLHCPECVKQHFFCRVWLILTVNLKSSAVAKHASQSSCVTPNELKLLLIHFLYICLFCIEKWPFTRETPNTPNVNTIADKTIHKGYKAIIFTFTSSYIMYYSTM